MTKALTGKDTIKVVSGPMGHCVDDLALWMKVVTNEKFYGNNYDFYHKIFPFE
jgi:hypothetical protein